MGVGNKRIGSGLACSAEVSGATKRYHCLLENGWETFLLIMPSTSRVVPPFSPALAATPTRTYLLLPPDGGSLSLSPRRHASHTMTTDIESGNPVYYDDKKDMGTGTLLGLAR